MEEKDLDVPKLVEQIQQNTYHQRTKTIPYPKLQYPTRTRHQRRTYT